jgi:hypothetical protein
MGKTVGEIEDIEMQEVEQWTNVHPSFASQLVQSWIDHNFTYQQTQEWIQAGLQSTEANLAAWLRDEKSKDLENFAEPEWLKKKINTGELNLNELRQAHQEEINDQNNNFEQQAQIQIPPKI